MIKQVITSVEKNGVTTVTKKEVLKCRDGYDGLVIGNYSLNFIMQI